MFETPLIMKLLGLAILALWVMGCSGTPARSDAGHTGDPQHDPVQRFHLGPLVDEAGYHRSLTLDAPAHHALVAFRPQLAEADPWYTDRLDRGPEVAAGQRSAIILRSISVTRDGFTSSRGRVYDNFRTRSITSRAVEIVQ